MGASRSGSEPLSIAHRRKQTRNDGDLNRHVQLFVLQPDNLHVLGVEAGGHFVLADGPFYVDVGLVLEPGQKW